MDKKKLLLDFYNAPNSEELHKLIVLYNLNGKDNWKPYGDNLNNAGTFENQQSSPENALVEKITNSIDAILMKECYLRNLDPKDTKNPNVPHSMTEAVEKFFNVKKGNWVEASQKTRNNIAQNIQIIVTSDKKTPNIAIYDNGEGQNPENFRDTFLSISRGNKNEVPFVQGKYNFGATGAMVFCGETYRYQMIISRRNQNLKDSNGKIGFTLVRKHNLTKEEESQYKLTWYEYLVIDDAIPYCNEKSLDLKLNKNKLFIDGSIVKLFSYQLSKPSMATLDLWRILNTLLYEPALPILIYEARNFNKLDDIKLMLGNKTRLAIDGRNNIDFEKNFIINIFDSKIPITAYIFKRDTINTEFILNKSIIFTLNGQTQGYQKKSFISQDLGFRNLREYMLICVDCSCIGTTARQELFMASRDRLKEGKYYNELVEEIINIIKNDNDIKEKNQEYKGKDFKENSNDKELIESFFSKLKQNENLKKLLSGNSGEYTFPNEKYKKDKKDKKNKKQEKQNLQSYPSIFKIKGFEKDKTNYIKGINKGSKGKIILETDAENKFLTRFNDPGSIEITTLDYGNNGGTGNRTTIPTENNTKLKVHYSGPYNGEIELIIEPQNTVEVGEIIPLSIEMISSIAKFKIIVFIKIKNKNIKKQNQKKITESELLLPKLIEVFKTSDNKKLATWNDYDMTANSILKIKPCDNTNEIDSIVLNMDSNLVKKLTNKKGNNLKRTKKKYITALYSHALFLYKTLFNYNNIKYINNCDKHIFDEINDNLNEAIEYSFDNFYANFLMQLEDISD